MDKPLLLVQQRWKREGRKKGFGFKTREHTTKNQNVTHKPLYRGKIITLQSVKMRVADAWLLKSRIRIFILSMGNTCIQVAYISVKV